MNLPYQTLNIAISELTEKYLQTAPYTNYVLCFAISDLATMHKKSHQEIVLQKNESLEDRCIIAYLKKQIPSNLKFPSQYNGIRIFQKYIGKVEHIKQSASHKALFQEI